jgi:hypothetical protein
MAPIDPPNPPAPPDSFTLRSRRVGAMLALGLMLASVFLMFVLRSGDAHSLFYRLATGLFLLLMPLAVAAGNYLGGMAAKCANASNAFWRGASSGPIAVALSFPFLLGFSFIIRSSRDIYVLLCVYAFLAFSGSLVTGVAAIYVRDYRQFQSKRWIPQFTLQEMFIVFTLISMIIACLTAANRLLTQIG